MLNLKYTGKSGKIRNSTTGFTLIEMIVSIALFSFVMLAATTVILSVIDANHKAQGLKITINNLSLALENIARNLRTGKDYQPVGNNSTCPSSNGVNGIRFNDQSGRDTIYRFNSGAIDMFGGISGFKDYFPITSPDISIDRLCFYITGASSQNDNIQPSVFITIGGVVNVANVIGAKEKTTSRFDIQTFVSQRVPDVPVN